MLQKLLSSVTQVVSHEETANHNWGRGVDERFHTDQQRIIHLLSENDGKMWQRGLIEETGWLPSKMSRTLSAMEQEGQIVRMQIGREKIVTVPESTAFDHGRSSGQSVPSDHFSQ